MRQEEQLKIQAKAKEYTEWRTEQLPKQMTMSTRNNSIIIQWDKANVYCFSV